LRHPLSYLYAKLGPRYPRLALTVQFQFAHVVTLAGVGLLLLYQRMSTGQLLAIVAVSQVLVMIENALSVRLARALIAPAEPWLAGRRDESAAEVAWRALATLPRTYTQHRRALAIAMQLVPISIFITLELSLPWYSVAILMAGAAVVLSYGVFLRFFAIELIMRPVLIDISRDLPAGIELESVLTPLRWKLLAALPAVNIITGVVVSAVSTRGQGRLADLGVSVVAAVVVAFTISLELTLLLSRSILAPIQELRAATRRVRAGDYGARVSVISTDETGALAGSFNEMVAGLQQREKLREAFGAFVDPELADRVLEEGTELEGEEVEVSVLFLDIRDFTAFAERSSAREVVGQLNDFYELVVPLLIKHGGHANKFIGDGLLGVFGAPDRRPDHADRAVAAALEISERVCATYGERLRIGIGVNSGPVVAGTIGGGGRLEFTVIGDPVNTAARVEAVTRETGDLVLITEATRCLLTRDFGAFEQRPTVELKGKTQAVALYSPSVAREAARRHAPDAGGADGRALQSAEHVR
jgi:class 3 adenylate cyclase